MAVLNAMAVKTTAQIPNAEFEIWEIFTDWCPPNHSYEVPDHWRGSLPTSCDDSIYSIEKNFDSYPPGNGQYSMIIKSNEDPFGSHGGAFSFDTAYENMNPWRPSFPLNDRPNSFCLFYKYSPVGGDSAGLKCLFFKNGVQIGYASDTVSQDIADWTLTTIPIKYNTSDTPDSATIFFSTYLNAQHTGSKLFVDNLSFNFPYGIFDQKLQTGSLKLHPNPASNIVSLNFSKAINEDLTICIYNIMGNLICTEIIQQNQKQININDLSNGIYIVTVKAKEWIEKQKLIINR